MFSTPPLIEIPRPPDSPDLLTTTSLLPGGTSLGMVMSVSPWLVMMSMSSSRVMARWTPSRLTLQLLVMSEAGGGRSLTKFYLHLYQWDFINRSNIPT